MQIIKKRLEYW